MSAATDTIRIAHTARCKLHLAANHPDRNFRLILGHALTLDKLLLRVAEIESDGSEGDEEGVADDEPTGPHQPQQRRVSFSATSRARHAAAAAASGNNEGARRRSPPPKQLDHDDDVAAEDDEDIEDDDDDDGDELSLQRFPSASAHPPRMVPDDDDDGIDDDEDEPVSPPDYTASEDELKRITEGATNPNLANQYKNVVRCPCHKDHVTAPKISNVWDLPEEPGHGGKRRALVQVEA